MTFASLGENVIVSIPVIRFMLLDGLNILVTQDDVFDFVGSIMGDRIRKCRRKLPSFDKSRQTVVAISDAKSSDMAGS